MEKESINFCYNPYFSYDESQSIDRPQDISESLTIPKLPLISASRFIFSHRNFTPIQTFRLLQLKEQKDILIIDFATGQLSDETLDRISDYVEKYGKKKIGNVSSYSKEKGTSYDLRLSDISDFFNDVQDITLAEANFRDYLIAKKLLDFDRNKNCYLPSTSHEVALITVRPKPDQNDLSRLETFLHEYAHGLYFVNPIFREKVSKTWESLNNPTKKLLSACLRMHGYESGEQWLFETELCSYAIENNYTRYEGLGNLFLSAYYYCHDISKDQKKNLDECQIIFGANGPNPNFLYLSLHQKFWKVFEPYLPDTLACMANSARVQEMSEALLPNQEP